MGQVLEDSTIRGGGFVSEALWRSEGNPSPVVTLAALVDHQLTEERD